MRCTAITVGAFMIGLIWPGQAMCQTRTSKTHVYSAKNRLKRSGSRGVTNGRYVARQAGAAYGRTPWNGARTAGTGIRRAAAAGSVVGGRVVQPRPNRTPWNGARATGTGIRRAAAAGSVVGGRVVQPRPINNQPDSVDASRGRARFFTNSGTSVLEGFRNRDNSIDYLNTFSGRYLYGKSNPDGSQDLFDPQTGNWLQGAKNRGGTVDYYDPRTGRWGWDTNRGTRQTPPQP